MASKARGLADLGNAFNDGALSNRNLIINGAMQVWQRGTSGSSGAGVYTADRFNVWNTAVAQSTDTPSGEGFLYSAQLTVTSQTSGNFAALEQRVEFEKIVAGRTLTLSFWVKGSTSGTAVVRNYSQSNGAGFGHTPFSVTTNWQRVAVTFTAPTLGGGSSDWCAFGIDFNVNNVSGLSYTGSGVSEPSYTGTVYLTGVQLEVGDTATPFEHRSYGQELALCQRYYYKCQPVWRDGLSGSYATTEWALPTTMRAAGTVQTFGYASGTSGVVSYYSSGWVDTASFLVMTSGPNFVIPQYSNFATNQMGLSFTIDAEL